jgi:S1-C subfamily serine protease
MRNLRIAVILAFAGIWPAHGFEPSHDFNAKIPAPSRIEGTARDSAPLSLKGFKPNDPMATRAMALKLREVEESLKRLVRGPQQIKVYRSAAPSVVLILTPTSDGSGSLISNDGFILTNWHVVREQSEVSVFLKPVASGQPAAVRAEVVKTSEELDLAVIKLAQPAEGRSPIPLGHLSSIEVGSDVIVIGHPRRLYWTLTTGIVSQIRQKYQWRGFRADVIQTQAPMNPGNSGGPLLNEDGQLIGVVSFKAHNRDSSMPNEGLGFAVSVDEVRKFLAAPASTTELRSPSGPDCEPKEIRRGRHQSRPADIVIFEFDCDWKATGMKLIPDDESKPIELQVDRNNDGKADVAFIDRKRDGRWSISYWDVDFDGKPDLIGHHPDGKMRPSRFERYRQ